MLSNRQKSNSARLQTPSQLARTVKTKHEQDAREIFVHFSVTWKRGINTIFSTFMSLCHKVTHTPLSQIEGEGGIEGPLLGSQPGVELPPLRPWTLVWQPLSPAPRSLVPLPQLKYSRWKARLLLACVIRMVSRSSAKFFYQFLWVPWERSA